MGDHCGFCRAAAQSKCGRCKKISYCSAQCQKYHWPSHKLICSDDTLVAIGLVNVRDHVFAAGVSKGQVVTFHDDVSEVVIGGGMFRVVYITGAYDADIVLKFNDRCFAFKGAELKADIPPPADTKNAIPICVEI